MQISRKIHNLTQRYILSSVQIQLAVIAVLVTLFVTVFPWNTGAAHAQTFAVARTCNTSDKAYLIRRNDTLSHIAEHYRLPWQPLATYNQLANPNLIYAGDTLCIPKKNTQAAPPATQDTGSLSGSDFQPTAIPTVPPIPTMPPIPTVPPISTVDAGGNNASAATGSYNPYPYGQCTWWADQRYYQLHGVYVPWTSNSDAWLWTSRAEEFGWHVSSKPTVGAIMDMQPDVQGASGLGHVAVVEQVLGDGEIIASSMNWGADPSAVTDFQFTPGPGITFITR